jgi:hypothetical protein
MNLGMLTRHGVRFRGPGLTGKAMDALSIAGITLLDRRPIQVGGQPVVEYVVAVHARGPDDAIARTRHALVGQGLYHGFAPDPE